MTSTTDAVRPSGLWTICELAFGILMATGLALLVAYTGTSEYWPVAFGVAAVAMVPLAHACVTLRRWLVLLQRT
jgi:hypothetical protein